MDSSDAIVLRDDRRYTRWRLTTWFLAIASAAIAVLVLVLYRSDQSAGPVAAVGVLYVALPMAAVSVSFGVSGAMGPDAGLRMAAVTSVAALILANLVGGWFVIPISVVLSAYFFFCVAYLFERRA